MQTVAQTTNRINSAITRMTAQVADRLASGQTTQDAVDKLHGTLDMDFTEFAKFQELKSASMHGALTPAEAQTIYGYLGNTPEHFNAQPIAVKAVLTQIFGELLGQQMAKRGAA